VCWIIRNIFKTHWKLDPNTYNQQLYVHLVERHWEHQNLKKFEPPFHPKGEKHEFHGCMLHQFISKEKIPFLIIFVTHFCFNLLPPSLIGLGWTNVIQFQILTWPFVWWVMSHLKNYMEIRKSSMMFYNNQNHVVWNYYWQACILVF
jgi:hypothetical protein